MLKALRFAVFFAVLLPYWACTTHTDIRKEPVSAGTTSLLQAISSPAPAVIWLSGHNGTVARSIDGGKTFSSTVVPGADTLQFRDVHAFSANDAVLMSAGNGRMSSIWRTNDGMKTFQEIVRNEDPNVFFDAIDFWPDGTGLLFGDSYEGKHFVLRSSDFGRTWHRISPDQLPEALPGEGAFAASGTSIQVLPGGLVRIATSSGPVARVLISADSGKSWRAENVPAETGDASGWASVFGDAENTFVLGGNLASKQSQQQVSAFSGGEWYPESITGMNGAAYGGDWSAAGGTLAASPSGLFHKPAGALSWKQLDTAACWSVRFITPSIAIATGPKGHVLRITGL
jgi:photosystem II stability/assembly factor-like uncharacterized protein